MVYSFSLISFIIIVHHFSISNASSSDEDNMLIAFMKGNQQIQISEYSMEKYEAYLGIVYFMRKYWHCDKIWDGFEEYERTECPKYRKYLDILYEYLYREYAGIPSVKPKFVFKKEFEINGPIIYAVNCLERISQFYFKWGKSNNFTTSKFFNYWFKPKLLNEERLNYKLKLENEKQMPINELILQLAIDTANNWQINESLDGIIQQIYGQKFEENLEEMYKKTEEMAKKDRSWNVYKLYGDKKKMILYAKFNDQSTWTEDSLFTEFVKGLATNFKKFSKMAEECSNYLSRRKEKEIINWDDNDKRFSFGLYEIEKMKKHLTQKYEAYFGVLYLMRENWHCGKIENEFEEKCQKYRNYLDIFDEYLFQLYVEGKNTDLAHKLSAVKPIFMDYEYDTEQRKLISVVQYLNKFSKYFWAKLRDSTFYWEMYLLNEDELNYEMQKENSGGNSSTQNEIAIAKLRKEFKQKMQKMYENANENAKEKKAKLEKAIENAANNKEKVNLKEEYYDKFGTFNSSPFS